MKIWGVMPEGLLERSFAEQRFNAGRGYDSDSNCEAVFALACCPTSSREGMQRAGTKDSEQGPQRSLNPVLTRDAG